MKHTTRFKTPALPSGYKNPEQLLRDLKKQPASYWIKRGQRRVLKLFHEMSEHVPAYRDFLKKKKVNPARVKSIADFEQIPPLDKQTYLRAYPIEKLCWHGVFDKEQWVIASTSGSTGEPFYFPRQNLQDQHYAVVAELYLRENFEIHKKSTLYIDAFPMGPWIGGVFTYEAITRIAQRGRYSLSIITTSVDKNEIIKAVRKFGDKFDQIIIGCYGSFLKDTLDDGIRQGLDWKKYDIKFVFSAEGFSETFRDYVINIAGLKNPFKDTLNHYGTVDLGTMAYETPLSIMIRRIAVANQDFYNQIFPVQYKLPTLTQYIPDLFYFEEVTGGLYCSAYSGIPLVRYDLKDHGGVILYETMKKHCAAAGMDIDQTAWKLPFVYVYERNDFSVSFYAFQIYPETIRKALQQSQFDVFLTGKFTMLVRFDDRQNQYIELNIELRPGKIKTRQLKQSIIKIVVEHLEKENSEYRRTHAEIGKRAEPKIVFWPYEYPQYFKPGIKQKWIQR